MLAHIDHPDSSVKSGSPREQEVLTHVYYYLGLMTYTVQL